MNKKELREFRRKLVKARRYVEEGKRVWVPIEKGFGVAYYQVKVSFEIDGLRMTAREFDNWCYSVSIDDVRRVYTNSIAALDARIAATKG